MKPYLPVLSVVLVFGALLACGTLLAPLALYAQRGLQIPQGPVPRWPDGHISFGPPPGRTGLWLPIDARLSRPESGPGRGPGGSPSYPNPLYSEVPFQPWARALLDHRLDNPFEPHARCKPSGGARQPLTPYGIEIVELPELERVFIFDLGGPQSYRIIFMDGRSHPDDVAPGYYGHSIGHWEGDTLVVDTIGFNERFWMDREGMPHTEELHFIERFTRTSDTMMTYEVTVDDPGAYTEPWSGGFYLRWSPGEELFEYVCQDNNYAAELMIGLETAVDQPSPIVP
jgi:hypothetical protein